MTIDFLLYPVGRIPALLRDITERGGVDVAVVKLNETSKSGYVEVSATLHSIPFNATGDALNNLHSAFNLRAINFDESLTPLSASQVLNLLQPSEPSRATDQLCHELKNAIQQVLPVDAPSHDWVIEIQGCHYSKD